MHKVTRSSLYNIFGYLYILAASFVAIPIILKGIGKDAFGVYLLFAGLIPVASSLDLGIASSVVRNLSRQDIDSVRKQKIHQAGLMFFLIMGVGVSLAAGMFVYYLGLRIEAVRLLGNTHYYALLIASIILINTIAQHFLSVVQAFHRFDYYNVRALIVGTATTLVSAWVAGRTHSLPAMLLSQLVFYLLALVFLVRVSRRLIERKTLLPYFHKQEWRLLVGFGLKQFLGQVVERIKQYFSKYYVGSRIAASSVAVYGIPQSITYNVLGLVSQVGVAAFPFSSEMESVKNSKRIGRLFWKAETVVVLLALLQVILVWVWGWDFLAWWLDDSSLATSAYVIWRIYSTILVLAATTPIPAFLMSGMGVPQVPSAFAAISTLIQISLIVMWTQRMGIMGVVYAELVANLVTAPLFVLSFLRFLRRKR